MSSRLATFLTLLFISANAYASDGSTSFFEPAGGFTFGDLSADAGGTSTTTTLAGPIGGFTFGKRTDWVYLFLAGSAGILTGKAGSTTTTAAMMNYGAGLGWDWAIPVRIKLGILATTLAATGNSTGKSTGMTFFRSLSYPLGKNLFLELQYNHAGLSATQSGTVVKGSANLYMASISLPIEFDYPEGSWRNKAKYAPDK